MVPSSNWAQAPHRPRHQKLPGGVPPLSGVPPPSAVLLLGHFQFYVSLYFLLVLNLVLLSARGFLVLLDRFITHCQGIDKIKNALKLVNDTVSCEGIIIVINFVFGNCNI